MQIHRLTGGLHTEQAQTPGQFLKALTPTSFGFEAHGLTAADVGALPLHGTADAALDADTLDGSHAAAFEPSITAPGDATKVWDGTKTFRYNDRLTAYDGSPATGLSCDTNAAIRIYDKDDPTASLYLQRSGANAFIYLVGGSPGSFYIARYGYGAAVFFSDCAEGKTQGLYITGYRTSDSRRSLAVAVGSNAADEANFSGLSNYRFAGTVNATTALATNGTTRIDSSGNITAAALTAGGFNAMRWRGTSASYPTSDRKTGDVFYKTDTLQLCLYDGTYWQCWDTTAVPPPA
jgi:hypothetical protein